MQGDKQLIAYRLEGNPIRDGIVYIDTDAGVKWNRVWMRDGDHAHVVVEPKDFVPTLDLRFAYGLTAKVEGSDAHRVDSVAEQAKKHAARVLTVVWADGEFGPHQITDTKGIMCS